MRIYKINNEYIDLDHVLSVTDIGWDKETTCHHYDAYFYVTLAFREERKFFGYRYSFRNDYNQTYSDTILEDEKQKAIKWHDDFLKAWTNKIT